MLNTPTCITLKPFEILIEIISANNSHSREIWEWRNNPVSKSMFHNNDLVSWEEHCLWFEESLKDSKRKMYIAINGKELYGIVRFDSLPKNSSEFEVSINLKPSKRGKGLSKEILELSICKLLKDNPSVNILFAEVKLNNITSNKLFKSLNFFKRPSSKKGFNLYSRNI